MSEAKTEEKKMAKKEVTTATQPKANGADSPELTISDLNALKSIIDVASSRGAFKPNEMMTVGQVYTKLEAFLAAVASQNQQGA